MDAAQKSFRSIALLILFTSLALTPWSAEAQTFNYPPANYTIYLSAGGTTITPTGTGDPGAPITYTVSVSYTSPDKNWLSVGRDQGTCTGAPGLYSYTTGTPLGIGTGCFVGSLQGTHAASVTLTDAANGSDIVTFTVSYTVGSISGGTIVATPNPIPVNLNAGASAPQVTLTTLSTTSTTPITFNIVDPNPATWLTGLAVTSNTVSANSPLVVVTGNVSTTGVTGTSASTLIKIQYGSSLLQIPVNLTVGSSTASSLIFSTGNTINWAYQSGNPLPTASVAFTNGSSLAGITYSVTYNSGLQWLLINNSSATTGTGTIGGGLSLTTIDLTNFGLQVYTADISINDTIDNLTGVLHVTLTVGAENGVTITPNSIPVTVPTGQGCCMYPTFTVSSSFTGTLSLSFSGFPQGAVSVFSPALPGTIQAGIPLNITLQIDPTKLFSLTYNGTVTATVNTTVQTANLVLTVGGAAPPPATAVAPTSLVFNYQYQSGVIPPPQGLVIVGIGTFAGQAPVQTGGATTQAWLNPLSTVAGKLTAAGVQTMASVSPASLTPGTYTGTYTIITYDTNGLATPQTVSVVLNVTQGPVLNPNPGSMFLNFNVGSAAPSRYFIGASMSDNSAAVVSASSTAPGVTATATGASTPTNVSLLIDPTALTQGLNSGAVTISANGVQAVVPVVITLTSAQPTGVLVATPSAATGMTFTAIANGTAPNNQTLAVTADIVTSFSATAFVSTPIGGSWLAISPSGSMSTNQQIQVAVNQTGLQPGSYTGGIQLTASGQQITVPVTLTVTSTVGGNVTVNPSQLQTFSAQVGSSTGPGPQTLSVSSASGSAGVPFTVAATSTGSWLTVSITQATTPAAVTVRANITGFAAGTYPGTVTITPTGGQPIVLQTQLVLQAAPTVSVPQTPLTFSYAGGGATPAAQNLVVTVTGTGGGFTASASSTGNWLTVSPTSGSATTTLSVQVGNLTTIGVGNYTGTITVQGTNGTQGSGTVTVNLSVTASSPTIAALVNAASYATGPVSPGEIVTLFGTALGPHTPAFLTLDQSGQNVLTLLGGVTVTFSGFAAPLTYVSDTQINAIVPYQVAGIPQPFVQVRYLNQTSNTFQLQTAVTAPGIFTAAGGTGQAAVLNGDGVYNGITPAARGSVIQIFMTGEGQTNPNGVTGAVTPVSINTPKPQYSVAVFIDNQPAQLNFVGEAPGLVSGVLQVNAVVPQTAGTGNVSLSVRVGANYSQNGVTVSVQ